MPENKPEGAPEHSQAVVFPPVIPVSGFLLGILVERLYPVEAWVSSPLRTGLRGLGAVVFCLGAAGFAWMLLTMKKARTTINSYRTPTTLVESGPFRRTRNPMYLFGSTAYVGLSLVLVQLWSLALFPVVFALTHYGVVLREEAFLERRFGDRYGQYKARVPRWL